MASEFEEYIKQASQDHAKRAELSHRADEVFTAQQVEFLVKFYKIARTVIADVLERARLLIEQPGKVSTVIRRSDDQSSLEFAIKMNGRRETLTFNADPLKMQVNVLHSSVNTGPVPVEYLDSTETVEKIVSHFVGEALRQR